MKAEATTTNCVELLLVMDPREARVLRAIMSRISGKIPGPQLVVTAIRGALSRADVPLWTSSTDGGINLPDGWEDFE